MEIILTDEMILADIEEFEDCIRLAKKKLAEMPATGATWQERKKLKAKTRELQSEIDHVKGLISIAREGLENC